MQLDFKILNKKEDKKILHHKTDNSQRYEAKQITMMNFNPHCDNNREQAQSHNQKYHKQQIN